MAGVGYDGDRDLSDDDDYQSASPGSSPNASRGHQLWEFERDIGQGGFGVVKLFVNKLTGAKIVLKECRQLNISREQYERWTQEMNIIERLDHKNIVRSQPFPDGLLYRPHGHVPVICMEFCEGGDLRQVLRDPENSCGLQEKDIRQICSDINAGIRFLHSNKVIHRDLKPENILRKIVDKNKVIYKLTDFGYAKSYDQSSVCSSLVGTMQYVAPEVLKGQKYNSSVDVWSFGVVVFECVTGIRPFLHGEPSMAIMWVDCVAKKAPKVIHLYFEDDGDKPVYSEQLPKPHQLSSPLADLMTTWLQTTLQYVPDMRGVKKSSNEIAPGLGHMQEILNTKVMNLVCTTTGNILSYTVQNTTTIGALKEMVECEVDLKAEDQYFIRPDGTIPLDSDLAISCIQEANIGLLFFFTISLMPSFKVMHDNNQAVERLTAYGDEKIESTARRAVFSHVFHHIRAHHLFFSRLHQAHRAIVHQIRIQCTLVREGQQNLLRKFDTASALISLLKDMLSQDQSRLQELSIENSTDPTISWDSMCTQLEGCSATLLQLTNQIAEMRKEAETYLRLADELIETSEDNGRQFAHYYQTYVVRARDILADIKINKGRQLSNHGRMQDVLLQAINKAQSIIETRLNGVSFCQEYVALGHLIQTIESYKESVEALQSNVTMLVERRTKEMWRLVEEQSKLSRRTTGLVMSTSEDRPDYQPLSVSRQVSSFSESSADSDQARLIGGNVNDIALVNSVSRSKLQRDMSQDETKVLINKNKQLLRRLESLPSCSPSRFKNSIDTTASLPSISSTD